ncbi:nicotinamide mononucleotide transporter [Hymenobacter taeanensis]|uniref:Nicotinamide riboside transporter PnuC n=1 Tax=Hymenobacter taeanensis TaxID=2735321 RepID=A0A6M6BDL1_9BACT|nr:MULTISPECIES: nicotinamide riboside transporter PnuC [Hymenobacter]QJX46040.1 nicotinamide mononucleotide transporter [Hymenobacter taeanensis]UOQ79894.1 nicotinamide riboside transporter PnuC [Hymenobacter sp. 5414T-23]
MLFVLSQSFYEFWTAAAGNTPLEWVAVVTGFACVWLAARESLWNFPVAIFSCALYIVVYFRQALYSDSLLQIMFIGLSVYGWYEWLYGGRSKTELPVSRTRRWEWLLCALFIPAFTFGFGYYLDNYTQDTVPYWDSFTTAGSLGAQFLMMRKRLENWWLWIIVDIVYVPILWHKQLYPTSVLYAVYLGLAAYGFWEWRRALHTAESSSLVSA